MANVGPINPSCPSGPDIKLGHEEMGAAFPNPVGLAAGWIKMGRPFWLFKPWGLASWKWGL